MTAPATAAADARRALAEGIRALSASGLPTARQDAEWLLAGLLQVERFALYAESPALTDLDSLRFRAALARRSAHEPLQYLLGWEEFRGLRLGVAPAVLIPRPETELLVGWVLELIPPEARVWDLGTGTGCIACAVAAERPDVRVLAVDLSPEACAIAGRNVALLGLDARVTVLAGDLFEPFARGAGPADVLVANPPYIPSGELPTLPAEVRDWEPRLAIDGGEDGMALSRRIVAGAPQMLREGGWLVMEIGDGQAPVLARAFRSAGFREIATRRDLAGVERFIGGRLPIPRRALG